MAAFLFTSFIFSTFLLQYLAVCHLLNDDNGQNIATIVRSTRCRFANLAKSASSTSEHAYMYVCKYTIYFNHNDMANSDVSHASGFKLTMCK